MTRVDFHSEARAEFFAATEYHEDRAAGLGRELVAEIERSLEMLRDYPHIGRSFGRKTRRVIVPRFPFALIYLLESDRLFMVAVMHLNRRPGYWRERARQS